MDNIMHAYEASEEADDTLSLSDLEIYSDPSSSEEESDNRNSSSFRYIILSSPQPEKVALFGNLICVQENDVKRHRKVQKASRVKTFPVQGKKGSGFLMFGLLGKSPTRMELGDLRSRQARGSRARIFPVNGGGGGEEEATGRRKCNKWLGKLFGACIPML